MNVSKSCSKTGRFHTKVTLRPCNTTWILTACRGGLDPLENDKQSPYFALLRPNRKLALKVWKKVKK